MMANPRALLPSHPYFKSLVNRFIEAGSQTSNPNQTKRKETKNCKENIDNSVFSFNKVQVKMPSRELQPPSWSIGGAKHS